MSGPGSRAHWDRAYAAGEDRALSWSQAEAQPSLDLIRRHGPGPGGSVIDVGAGAARLVDGLLDAGHDDITLFDISDAALQMTRDRLGARGARVTFVTGDVTAWRPTRRWDVWHDRAVLHFLVGEADRNAYRDALVAATHPGSIAVIGTFAPDGPERCSGLPVQRWSADELAEFLAPEFSLLARRRHMHETPGGASQSFEFAVLRRA